MWLRSQDKKRLVNSNFIFIEDNNLFAQTNDGVCGLGRYESTERALQVLEAITRALGSVVYVTYQMPEQ